MGQSEGQIRLYADADVARLPGRSAFWQRFVHSRSAVIAASLLAAIVAVSILAPWLAPHDPHTANLRMREQPPGPDHLLGTDSIGRDVLSRLLWGGRISLIIGITAAAISVGCGALIGAIAAVGGVWIDSILMRCVDVLLSFPKLVLLIVSAAIVPPTIPSLYTTVAVIGLISWPGVARLVRGQLLTLRERDFVLAARAAGASRWRLIWQHLLPNAVGPLLVAATLDVAGAMSAEAALSFLSLGVQPPVPTWGNMLMNALSWRVLAGKWWLWVPPGLMLFVTVLTINLIGDSLRDALDPQRSAARRF